MRRASMRSWSRPTWVNVARRRRPSKRRTRPLRPGSRWRPTQLPTSTGGSARSIPRSKRQPSAAGPPLRSRPSRGSARAARQIETEAAPIRYVAELVGADTDAEGAIRWLILMMVYGRRGYGRNWPTPSVGGIRLGRKLSGISRRTPPSKPDLSAIGGRPAVDGGRS
jgi:hypothetical protein